MQILAIYKNYKIPPNLQTHMLRVAAVSSLIADNIKPTDLVEKEELVTACLLHDMGNIIKFDLAQYPELLKPKGHAYWKNVQDEFIQKYGRDEHQATFKIAEEIGIPKKAREILHAVGFAQSDKMAVQKDLSKKIILYSDQRVGIYGILSLEERLTEGRKRFLKRMKLHSQADKKENEKNFERLFKACREIEKQIFVHCNIKPEQITDESTRAIMAELKNFTIASCNKFP